ncbi:hypothetical protein BDV40DRAFT_244824 [Aspergillus tamarii]|uniref:Uncharacterized protein n=1 Tax=Aspergillus tamarii TaxID=41984 RepID=A0A5N6UL32_ASPTM|nr:hypothetical protein BDV40DRAFT_244824 [Aspergillus tamarii]
MSSFASRKRVRARHWGRRGRVRTARRASATPRPLLTVKRSRTGHLVVIFPWKLQLYITLVRHPILACKLKRSATGLLDGHSRALSRLNIHPPSTLIDARIFLSKFMQMLTTPDRIVGGT